MAVVSTSRLPYHACIWAWREFDAQSAKALGLTFDDPVREARSGVWEMNTLLVVVALALCLSSVCVSACFVFMGAVASVLLNLLSSGRTNLVFLALVDVACIVLCVLCGDIAMLR